MPRDRRRWAALDVNTPPRTTVRSTVTGELGEFYGIGGDGKAHVYFDGDPPGVVDRIDPETLRAEVTSWHCDSST